MAFEISTFQIQEQFCEMQNLKFLFLCFYLFIYPYANCLGGVENSYSFQYPLILLNTKVKINFIHERKFKKKKNKILRYSF